MMGAPYAFVVDVLQRFHLGDLSAMSLVIAIHPVFGCAGGVFKLELFLPEEYPMAAPKVSFQQSVHAIAELKCFLFDGT